MKATFSILVFFSFALSALAQQSAYTALRILGEKSKSAYLNQVVEMVGTQGATQPLVWKIIVSDSAARSGIREFEIANGSILSERTPVGNLGDLPSRSPMMMANLNLDSDGAFTVANKIAIMHKVGFDTVHYTLRSSANGSQPQWLVDLVAVDGQIIRQVLIAADTGEVLSGNSQSATMNTTETSVLAGSQSSSSTTASDEPGAVVAARAVGRGLKTAGTATKNTTLRTLGSVQKFFTGKRTIDKNVPQDED